MLVKNKWESNFFQKKIYTLDHTVFEKQIFDTEIEIYKPDIIACKIETEKQEQINTLIESGFFVASVSLNFHKLITDKKYDNNSLQIRNATPNDIERLKDITIDSFINSRFGYNFFGNDAANKFYSEWVRKAVLGTFDEICIVISNGDDIAGYISCKKISQDTCKVGLVNVDKKYRQRGNGTKLVNAAETYFANLNVTQIKVTSQPNNKNVQFYTKNGYFLKGTAVWLYYTNT